MYISIQSPVFVEARGGSVRFQGTAFTGGNFFANKKISSGLVNQGIS